MHTRLHYLLIVLFATTACSGQLLITMEEAQQCEASSECGEDRICLDGLCAAEDAPCGPLQPNGRCPPGLICENTMCVVFTGFSEPCGPNNAFGECPDPQVCDGVECVDPTQLPCAFDIPRGLCTGPTEVCREGTCEEIEPRSVCSERNQTGECPGPSVCVDGQCFHQACGNGATEPTEMCDGVDHGGTFCSDLGFSGGVLGCDACVFDTSRCTECGDGIKDLAEQCDAEDFGTLTCQDLGSFSGGTLLCNDACQVETSACTVCGDGARNGGESCEGSDLGGTVCSELTSPGGAPYSGGTLACDTTCGFDVGGCDWCGDGFRGASEACEGGDVGGTECTDLGFDGGVVGCGADCQFNTSGCFECGNDSVEGTEVCDGTDVRGLSCASVRMIGGTLGCSMDCDGFDTTGCGLAMLEIRPAIGTLQAVQGQSTQQSFEAWATYADGTEEKVSATWFVGDSAHGSISASGTYASQGALTQNVSVAVIASFAGTATSLNFQLEIVEASDCGDGALGPGEQCDCGGGACDPAQLGGETCMSRGFTSGTLGCDPACAFDVTNCSGSSAVCNDGVVEGAEACDCPTPPCSAAQLDSRTCMSEGFASGELGCDGSCALDTSLCSNQPPMPEFIDLVVQCVPSTDCPEAGGVFLLRVDENGAPLPEITALASFDDDGNGTIDRVEDLTSVLLWTLTDGDGPPYNSGLGAFDPVAGTFVPGGAAGTVNLTVAFDEMQTSCATHDEPAMGFDVCRTVSFEISLDPDYVATPTPDAPLPFPVPDAPGDFFVDTMGNDLCPGDASACCNGSNGCTVAPAATDLPFVVYPNHDTALPRNIHQVLFQWNRGMDDDQTSLNLFRARFDNDLTNTHVSIYTTADRWRPSPAIWRLVTDTNAGGSVDFSVEAVKLTCAESDCSDGVDNDGDMQTDNYLSDGSVYASVDTVTVRISAAEVPGAIYYWSTAVEGIKKASISNDNPINFYWPEGVNGSPPGAGVGSRYDDFQNPTYVPDPDMGCVACHGMSRDGTQLAMSYNRDGLNNIELSGAIAASVAGEPVAPNHVQEIGPILSVEGTPGPAQVVVPVDDLEFPSFNDTGELIAGGKGDLTLIDSQTGETLGPDPIPVTPHPDTGKDDAQHADFSPNGRWLAFSYKGKGIGVQTYDKDEPGLPAVNDAGDNRWGSTIALVTDPDRFYPAFSPDSLWLLFNSGGEKNDDDSLLYVLEWAECDPTVPHPPSCAPSDPVCECRPVPICRSPLETTAALTLPWRAREVPPGPDLDISGLPACQPVLLTRLNHSFNNCDRDGPWAPCLSNDKWQHNMARWAPTNRPDVFFIVFTSHRPYGKISGGPTGDQLWVGGFDPVLARTGADGSFPAFWLPFQFLSETNHRAYWTQDVASPVASCNSPEVCDGLDNDCDGIVDEDCCVPEAETCDNLDNDCDGVIDNGVRNACGMCGPPPAEACDGVDNDCDGSVDEGCTGCQPSTEVCDFVDNDCDGAVDELDTGTQPGNVGDGVTPNPGAPPGCPCFGPEVCDGVDNDCDGFVDDLDSDIMYSGGLTCCFPASSDPCNGADDDCDGIVDNGCCVPTSPPAEVCDTRDNDCDGLIDEADPDLGPGACCPDADSDGYTVCAGDCADDDSSVNPGVAEDAIPCQPNPLCGNGIDENCDGEDCINECAG